MNHTDLSEPIDTRLDDCEAILDYRFRDRELLRRALTHSSIALTRLDSNERMEFLGDAVLGFAVCELLFQRFPEYPEGELTRIKSSLVSRSTCAKICRQKKIDRCLYLGKGLTTGGAKIPPSIISASLEAVIAALYLDGGYDVAQRFIEEALSEEMTRLADEAAEDNYKSMLQQIAQRDFQQTPVYELLDEKGPDHFKCFKISAKIGEQLYHAAWGNTKKQAEQRAARNALCALEGEPIPFAAD